MGTSSETKLNVEPSKQIITIEREFDVNRNIVFDAFTDAELFAQWMGPSRLSLKLETFEPYNGGSWKYVNQDEFGTSYVFRGVFHEVTKPERIIQTFEYEGLPERGHVKLETWTFEELSGGCTRIVMESVFRSVEDRDNMLRSGMEEGVMESFDRLTLLLGKLKSN
ncbi:SRPBCC family protein [Cohnella yongneupensis]|uniref:SRPBCC family protein n=1 Tax=Cohnella yongneupensis TaxID=425006 RepID=A0ABW0R212_9BACL